MSIPYESLSLRGSTVATSSWYWWAVTGQLVSGTSITTPSEEASSGSGPSQSMPYCWKSYGKLWKHWITSIVNVFVVPFAMNN